MLNNSARLPIISIIQEEQEFESQEPKYDSQEPDKEGGDLQMSFCKSPEVPFYSIKEQDDIASPFFNKNIIVDQIEFNQIDLHSENNQKEIIVSELTGENFKSTSETS